MIVGDECLTKITEMKNAKNNSFPIQAYKVIFNYGSRDWRSIIVTNVNLCHCLLNLVGNVPRNIEMEIVITVMGLTL